MFLNENPRSSQNECKGYFREYKRLYESKKKKKEEEEVINLWIYWIYLKDFLIFKIIRIFLNLELKKIFQFLYESKKLIELYKFVKLMT